MDIPSNDLDTIKVALKLYTCSTFGKYKFLNELNLSKDEYNALKKDPASVIWWGCLTYPVKRNHEMEQCS